MKDLTRSTGSGLRLRNSDSRRSILSKTEGLKLEGGDALVVVAHPDDETIWMGGTILAHLGVRWTVYALCKRSDPDRAPKFPHAMRVLHAHGIITDFADDDDRVSVKELSRKAEKLITKALSKKSFDYIFTHASDGEYGNLRHKGVHRAVRNLLQSKKLRATKSYCFAYQMAPHDKFAIPKKKADFEIKLPKSIFNEKVRIIKDIYGFQPKSFEYLSCIKVESFNALVL